MRSSATRTPDRFANPSEDVTVDGVRLGDVTERERRKAEGAL